MLEVYLREIHFFQFFSTKMTHFLPSTYTNTVGMDVLNFLVINIYTLDITKIIFLFVTTIYNIAKYAIQNTHFWHIFHE